MYVVARNFCLALPGCSLAKQVDLLGHIWTYHKTTRLRRSSARTVVINYLAQVWMQSKFMFMFPREKWPQCKCTCHLEFSQGIRLRVVVTQQLVLAVRHYVGLYGMELWGIKSRHKAATFLHEKCDLCDSFFRRTHSSFVVSFLYGRHYSFSILGMTSMTNNGERRRGREQICVTHKDPLRYRTRAQ